jgi:hypothetical protein
MSHDWEFFPCTMGEHRAFIFVDVGVKDTIDTDAPPRLVKIRLTYRDPRPDGFPTPEEFEPVKAIEEELDSFAGDSGAWYVGRVTAAGYRIFHVYTDAPDEQWWSFAGELADRSGYELALAFQEDPDHATYWNELYPTPDDWQVIKDIRVIEALAEQGDDGTAARQVDHWAYFDREDDARPFIAWAESDRFTYEQEHSGADEDGRFCVRLSHHGTVELRDLSSHTIALRQKAVEHGGTYEGWEVPVLKSED